MGPVQTIGARSAPWLRLHSYRYRFNYVSNHTCILRHDKVHIRMNYVAQSTPSPFSLQASPVFTYAPRAIKLLLPFRVNELPRRWNCESLVLVPFILFASWCRETSSLDVWLTLDDDDDVSRSGLVASVVSNENGSNGNILGEHTNFLFCRRFGLACSIVVTIVRPLNTKIGVGRRGIDLL